MDIDSHCFYCGDKISNPCMVWRGFVKGQRFVLAFHFDCYFQVASKYAAQFEETRKLISESDKRPRG